MRFQAGDFFRYNVTGETEKGSNGIPKIPRSASPKETTFGKNDPQNITLKEVRKIGISLQKILDGQFLGARNGLAGGIKVTKFAHYLYSVSFLFSKNGR